PRVYLSIDPERSFRSGDAHSLYESDFLPSHSCGYPFILCMTCSAIASEASIPVASYKPLKPGETFTSITYVSSADCIISTPAISTSNALEARSAVSSCFFVSLYPTPLPPRCMLLLHSFGGARRRIAATTLSPTPTPRIASPGLGTYF